MPRIVWCRSCGSVSISDMDYRCFVCRKKATPIGSAGINGDSLIYVPIRKVEFDTIYSALGTFKRVRSNVFKKVRRE